ncbi:hypothetical protein E4U22_002342 [Claviceps purpurea]|nr:hypothetical protein E4U22_002342 [Claviceps purpurea]
MGPRIGYRGSPSYTHMSDSTDSGRPPTEHSVSMRTSGGGGAPLSMALSAPHFSRLVTRESPFAPGLASWRPHGVAQFPGASVSRLTMSGCVLSKTAILSKHSF